MIYLAIFYFFLSGLSCKAFCEPFPISFSISEKKIVKDLPKKDKDFSSLIPGKQETYIYTSEESYYKEYQRSYYALTFRKAGTDCLRHYEILANGCIPYFVDLDLCHPKTMVFFPKDLVKEAMNLEGVSYLKIDHSKFDKKKYFEILNKLIQYTRQHLTSRNIAQYMLNNVKYSGEGKILFLSQDPAPDYLCCLTLIGLKELLGDKVIDFPKISYVYKNYVGNISNLYGKGFTYTKILDDLAINRGMIKERILNKEFAFIIYGSVHRGMPYYDIVTKTYPKERIVYMCGEDAHKCQFYQLNNLFIREFDAIPY